MTQEFTLKNVDETRKYFLKEIEQNKLMCKKDEKVCTTLNYMENFLISTIISTCIIFITVFKFLVLLFVWYSYWNYEFCNRIKNLCNNCRN